MFTFEAHVPTLLGMVIACSLMMAISIATVGSLHQRDGLTSWAVALLVNAAGHCLLLLRGTVPDVLSILLANVLLSAMWMGIKAAIYQFQGRGVPWLGFAAGPALVGLLVILYLDSFTARVAAVALVLAAQVMWALIAVIERWSATEGRGLWLLAGGLGLTLFALIARLMMVVLDVGMTSNILQASALQTLTFVSVISLVLVSTMGFVFMLRDRLDASNRYLAAVDALTGIANRRALLSVLERDVSRAQRTGDPIALMMVDIDHFKLVNDRYGHPMGDRVLRCVAELLRERVRAQDFVGRYGGEEFLIILPDTGLEGARQLAGELCMAVQALRCGSEEGEGTAMGGETATQAHGKGAGIDVTVSIGVYGGLLRAGDSWDLLVAAADRALYRAKENGRNRVEFNTALRRPPAGDPTLQPDQADTLPAPLL